jgi:hypothetical protein
VVGLAAGGGAYAWLTRGAFRRVTAPAPPGAPARLVFRETVWPHDPADPDAQLEFEWRRPGCHDFAFRSEGEGPVRVRLESTGCACTKVELGIAGAGAAGDAARDSGTIWHALRPEDAEGIAVPAHAAGALRVSWRGEELGPKRLTAELRLRPGEAEEAPVTLEVPLEFVRPVRLAPADSLEEPPDGEIETEALGPGAARTLRLIAWSSTRGHFSLKPAESADPHVGCGGPEPLGALECERLAREHGTRVLCAYLVPVTVRERTGDGNELDLGPFSCQIRLTSDADIEPAVVTLSGMVHGPLTVGTEADRGAVALGTFQRGEGKSRELTLSTAEERLDLRVEEVPDFLKVSLREAPQGQHGKVWRLTVAVSPNSLIGSIPPHTAVVLRTTGSVSRRVRIPVTGYSYLK